MATQVKKQITAQVTPRFKKSRSQRVNERKNKSAVKRAKRPGNDLAHLKNIKRLPCIVTGVRHNMDPHHLKCMGERGAGMRSTDSKAVPLTREQHNKVEALGSSHDEQWFWDHGIDCKKLANELWLMRTNFPDMEAVWQKHWDKKPKILKQASQ